MSTHFKITPFKSSPAGGKHKVSKGGKKAAKGHLPFGHSLSSANGRGFKGKGRGITPSADHPTTGLDGKETLSFRTTLATSGKTKSKGKSVTSGKAATEKKRVQAQGQSPALFVPALSQAAPSFHKKKIVSLYIKSGPHKSSLSKGVKLKALGKARGQGKAELLKGSKGRAKVHGHVKTAKDGVSGKSGHTKRAGGTIKKVIAHKGPIEKLSEVQAQKRPLKKTVERGPLDKPIDLSPSPPAKPVSLKARAEALRGGLIPSIKGAPLRGAGKKSRPALSSLQAVKKAGSKRAGIKKKTVKRLNRVSGTPIKAAYEAQSDAFNGMGEVSEGVRLSEGLPFAIATPHEKALQGGHGLSLTGGNGKAVFKDPSAIINTSVSIAPERTQARVSGLTAAPHHDLAGRQGELIEKASGGVLLSLRQADKEIVIKLSPEELGRMEIKVKVHHGLVDASILVDNPDVMAMLNANNTALKDQLARQGLMLGGLEVALNRQDTTPHDRGELNGGNGGAYGRGRQAVKGVGKVGEGRPIALKTSREGGAQGGLDLFI